MTSRIEDWIAPAMPPAGTARVMSDTEAARAEAEAEQHASDRRRAARVIAACSLDVDDFRTLADMLGLDDADIAAARHDRPTRRGKRHAA